MEAHPGPLEAQHRKHNLSSLFTAMLETKLACRCLKWSVQSLSVDKKILNTTKGILLYQGDRHESLSSIDVTVKVRRLQERDGDQVSEEMNRKLSLLDK